MKFQFFPQVKKQPKLSYGRGGQKNYGLFPIFVTFFMASLRGPISSHHYSDIHNPLESDALQDRHPWAAI